MVRSLPREYSYRPAVVGRIPQGLRGTLYRNGPGLFERDGFRKRCLLDGDGMVQAFRFDDTGVHYQNRFVTTPKYLEEEAAGRFRYQSWTTVAPGGALANLGIGDFLPSAGVNAVAWGDGVWALEDASHPYRIDPDSLDTLGEDRFGVEGGIFNAHPKMDPARGQWIHTGIGVTSKELHLTIVDGEGRQVRHRRYEIERGGYVHDCLVTRRYVVVIMSPVGLSPMGFVLGRNSVAGSFRWQGDQPNHVYVIERDGEGFTRIDAPSLWTWHSINAVDRDGEIVADFVGYDEPDHFIGEDPFFWAVMEGRFVPARHFGTIRRHVIDPRSGRIREEILHDARSSEYPTVNPQLQCGEYRYAYLAAVENLDRGLFHDRVMRIDMQTGASDEFHLGEGRYCGETVFVPKPGVHYSAALREEPGWLLTLVYDVAAERSELAVFEAEGLADGPIARIPLRHHTPFSFHGSWRPASRA
jgi:all-trans-8'-apo-beta-carotenal 15,15'-oxygenase